MALFPNLTFALSMANFEISKTVRFVNPALIRLSTKKLSPPPISIIASSLLRLASKIKSKDVCGIF